MTGASGISLIDPDTNRKDCDAVEFESLAEALPMWRRTSNQITKLDKTECLRALAAMRIEPTSQGVVYMRGLIKSAITELREKAQEPDADDDMNLNERYYSQSVDSGSSLSTGCAALADKAGWPTGLTKSGDLDQRVQV